MSNCPYCGSKKVAKTFNFNEYTCSMCESDYKLTESGTRIFREGSWKALCLSTLSEMANKVTGASVTDILSKVLRTYSKQSPNDIDLVVEDLTTIAGNLHSEWKANLRSAHDFHVVMEGIAVFEKAAFALKKRETELNLRIRINEMWEDTDALDQPQVDPVKNDTTADIGEDPIAAAQPIPGGMEEADDELDSIVDAPEAPAADETAPEASTDAPVDVPELDTEAPADASLSKDELIANVEDAAETVEDKLSRIVSKVTDLKSALTALKGSEAPIEPVEPVEPEVPATEPEAAAEEPAPETAPEAEEPEANPAEPKADKEIDDILNSSYNRMGKTIYESILSEANKKDRADKKKEREETQVAGVYSRKVDNTKAVTDAEKTGEPIVTDMTAKEVEEPIPFTKAVSEEIDDKTNNTGLGAVKGKPKNKDAKTSINSKDYEMKTVANESRDGFNGFRVGDEILLEGSSDLWKIAEIDDQLFTLVRGKTATVVDTFKSPVRHADTRLEWQRTNELIGETAKRWKSVEESYNAVNEACVGGVCGLGGGNRLGGEKVGMGGMLLSPATSINMSNLPSSKVSKNSIYKFIKDNDLHRVQREVAMPRISETFTNPVEEMTQILDDAILSETDGQTEQIDSLYDYKSAPLGEHARKDAFSKGWQTVNESEEKPEPKKVEPLKGVGFYRTKENDIIDVLGRTAAQRLLGE